MAGVEGGVGWGGGAGRWTLEKGKQNYGKKPWGIINKKGCINYVKRLDPFDRESTSY